MMDEGVGLPFGFIWIVDDCVDELSSPNGLVFILQVGRVKNSPLNGPNYSRTLSSYFLELGFEIGLIVWALQ